MHWVQEGRCPKNKWASDHQTLLEGKISVAYVAMHFDDEINKKT